MADQTDHLGRKLLNADDGGPQTVTQFAVESGAVPSDGAGVQEAVDQERQRAQAGTERAQLVSDRMAPDPATTETENAGE